MSRMTHLKKALITNNDENNNVSISLFDEEENCDLHKLVKQNHENQIKNGYTNEINQNALIEIFGGNEEILKHYKITQQENIPTHLKPTYYLSYGQTIANSICCKRLSEELPKIISHKIVVFCVSISILIGTMAVVIESLYESIAHYISLSILIIYFIFLFLTINRKAFGLIIWTFNFWFKTICCIILVAAKTLYFYSDEPNDKLLACLMCQNIVVIMGVININFIDVLQLPKKIALLYGIGGSCFFILQAIVYFISEIKISSNKYNKDGIYTFGVFGLHITLQLMGLIDSMSRVLAIFMIKQSVIPLIKGASALIKAYPKIKWIKYLQSNNLITGLGGIDEILKHYLLSNPCPLTQSQLKSINQIVPQTKISNNNNTKRKNKYNAINIHPIYHFSWNNTILINIIGVKIGNTISKFLFNKILVFILIIMWSLSIYDHIKFVKASEDNYWYIFSAVSGCIYVIWYLLVLLSVNIEAFKLIIGSFEFWFKVIYCIKLVIFRSLRVRAYEPVWEMVLAFIIWIQIIIVISSYDAIYYLSKCNKILCGIIGSIFFTVIAVYYTILEGNIQNDHYSTFNIFGYSMTINLISHIANPARLVCLFLITQTIKQIANNGEIVMINVNCFIKWVY